MEKKERAEVSIIIPVYNAEKYIVQCIESVQNQTLSKIEIIIIDDGSTDASGAIADGYAQKDSRIKVLHYENGGLVRARKRGISAASSEYIGFVDADDWIDPCMYAEMLQIMETYHVDIVLTEIYHYMVNGEHILKHPVKNGLYDHHRIVGELYPKLVNSTGGLHPSVCIKLFKKALLEPIIDRMNDNIRIAEDAFISYSYLSVCEKVYVLEKAFYHYRMNQDSMCHKKNYNVLSETELMINELRKIYEENHYSEILLGSLDRVIYSSLLFDYKFHASNALTPFYLFPYSIVEKGSKIIIYGAGNVGTAYYRQLKINQYCQIVLWVDSNWKKYPAKEISPPDMIKNVSFDYIVIATAEEGLAKEIESYLVTGSDVEQERILYQTPLEGMHIMQTIV